MSAGKTILILGGTSDIGRATAKAFAARGWSVELAGRDMAAVQREASDIAARTGGSSVMISNPEQYAVVLGNLQAIVMRRVGFNRVRLVLDAGAVYGSQAERTFESGNTVWTYVGVRVASGSSLLIPVVIPIP